MNNPAPAPNITLNAGQQAAADGFLSFLHTDDREMIISGPGGVGKSFTMAHLIDHVVPAYFDTCKLMGTKPVFDDVHVTATTNKATEVVSLATKRPADTIYSYLNLKVQDDYKTGKSIITKSRNWQVQSKKLIFIDEYSMVDRALLNSIDEGLTKSKIVYVGDHCQMAPVLEKSSPVDSRGIKLFELTEPVRNAEQPALIDVCNQLRHTVKTGIFQPIKLVPGVIDHVDDAGLESFLHTYFSSQSPDMRILAYTNKRVVQYNDHIRSIRNLPDEYQTGELLVNNSAVRVKSNYMLSVEEQVEIVSQQPNTYEYAVDDGVKLELRDTTITTRLGGMITGVGIPVNRNHFLDLIAYYKRQKNWKVYFDLRNNYPDLRQHDACTVYKAQGSTYNTVLIDIGNISTCNVPDQVARMLYVAFSRPTTRVVLYGNLASKYGGLIF